MLKSYIIFKRFHFSLLLKIIAILLSIMTTFGFIIYSIEPNTFGTIFNGIWWAVVTTFTVGYGDVVPKTTLGKLFGMLLILVGTGLGSYYMILFASQIFTKQESYLKGELSYKKNNHTIIIGWNERTKNMFHQLQQLCPDEEIVLIDDSLSAPPIDDMFLYFIRGNATEDTVLQKANIHSAKRVIITADQHKNELDADIQSIMTIISIKGIQPSIYCIVEILTNQHILNAKRVGADEVIEGNTLTSYMMTTAALYPSASTLFVSLANQLSNQRISMITMKDEYCNKTFEQCCLTLLKRDLLLIGVKRKGELILKPSPSFQFQEDDIFIVISN
ncbi:potassium channel family protein [Priestia taiwanensis]|uniref:Potassium channel protein n=1 Tax=Priestia taiwanensis TaxID=1347902 RepID=A0A917AWV5_9BACI|nr:potassium channel family protein [Priestia taiwanensis]MBM7364614.1 voltage-gated potassium channel [Priestia taiwanensis]GGE80135.1 potassium channel protein [Priestia taiwanensis]